MRHVASAKAPAPILDGDVARARARTPCPITDVAGTRAATPYVPNQRCSESSVSNQGRGQRAVLRG
eukprot:7696251-Pyramimonas_sp.AAC.1